MPTQPPADPAAAALQVIAGFWSARAVHAAAKLGIADLVQDGPKTVEDLASRTGTHTAALYRLLRALASIGWLAEDATGRFGPTDLTAAIQTGTPGTLRHYVITELGQEHYPAWEELLFSVSTGQIAFDHVFKSKNWQFWASHPDYAQIFNRGMSEFTAIMEPAVQEAYDFSHFSKIVDVGGGRGTLMALVLRSSPNVRAVVLDLPHVIELGKRHIEEQGLSGRCELVAGDFFKSVPEGGDAYILQRVLHDWDDDHCVAILRNCRSGMRSDGKVCVIESIIPAGNQPSFQKLGDLNMLVMTGGRERTEAEYENLFDAAGLRLNRIATTSIGYAVMESVQS